MITTYKDFRIIKDLTVRQDKFYTVINHNVLYGGTIEIVKRKIDKFLKNLEEKILMMDFKEVIQ